MNAAPNSRKHVTASTDHPSGKRGITSRPWWPWVKHALTLLFFALVAYLLFTQARSVEWDKVFETMRRRPLESLLIAASLAAASHFLYSCFDLLGRYITGHGLRTGQVLMITFISYAFNLNLGSLVGGVAFRYRLYSRHGVDAATVTRVMAMSMLTNWLGYLLLAGLAFWWWPMSLPDDWKIDTFGLRVLGFALFSAAAVYMLMCALSSRRIWTIRGHELMLPTWRLAMLQLVMSSVNWMLMAGVMYTLLDQKIDYPIVLGVLLTAAVAGVVTHVPAGLGVLEAVFVALLSHEMPKSELLAALLTYRAVYYLAPLALATVLYLLVEVRAKKSKV